ncbi:MAG: hypothetical protein JNM00_05045, partial [Flavobacteriales bacterium]|nr:hypothetical protein [Flavobacteriales bacterium]
MKQRTTLALVAMLAFVMAGQATILRVNPDPLSIAQYHDPVTAMSEAFPGDTIYVEGNAGTGVSGILSVYPVMTISKPLHFVGPGYFLAENNIYSDGMLIPEFSALLLTPAASGTTFNGLKIHQLQINNADCAAVHCFIGQLVMNNCTSGFFRKNYFYSNIGVTPVSLSGCSGIAFNNNFIGSSTLSDDGEITLDINLSPGVSFTNNTFAGGVCNTG